jgi:hypothetical protein
VLADKLDNHKIAINAMKHGSGHNDFLRRGAQLIEEVIAVLHDKDVIDL